MQGFFPRISIFGVTIFMMGGGGGGGGGGSLMNKMCNH